MLRSGFALRSARIPDQSVYIGTKIPEHTRTDPTPNFEQIPYLQSKSRGKPELWVIWVDMPRADIHDLNFLSQGYRKLGRIGHVYRISCQFQKRGGIHCCVNRKWQNWLLLETVTYKGMKWCEVSLHSGITLSLVPLLPHQLIFTASWSDLPFCKTAVVQCIASTWTEESGGNLKLGPMKVGIGTTEHSRNETLNMCVLSYIMPDDMPVAQKSVAGFLIIRVNSANLIENSWWFVQ